MRTRQGQKNWAPADTTQGDSLENQSDETLMTAYQQGNEKAFALLYGRHSAKVYGFLHKRLQDRTMIDEVFQETFLKLHGSRARFDNAYPFLPWLFTICRTTMIDHIRGLKNERDHKVDLGADSALKLENFPAPPETDPDDEMPALPDLSILSATQQQTMELRYKEELSFEEIALRLQTSPGNVRQLVSRAIKKLKSVTTGNTSKGGLK